MCPIGLFLSLGKVIILYEVHGIITSQVLAFKVTLCVGLVAVALVLLNTRS